MKKEKLYRKENKKSLSSLYNITTGGEYRWNRSKIKRSEDHPAKNTMKKLKLGRDYTPLFRYLISSVGRTWNDIYSEIKPRLDTTEPIWWLVKNQKSNPFARIGESTYYHTLYVDENGILQYIDETAKKPF